MRKIVLVCGVIAGLITICWYFIVLWLFHGHLDNGEIYGYASMILAFSLIYVGVRNFRDKYSSGLISFGKAFLIGLYITLVASTIYVGTWEVIYYGFYRDFGKVYGEHQLARMKEKGASAKELADTKAKMDDWAVSYDKPLINISMTYMEILPVGLVVSVITGLILRRSGSRETRPALQETRI